MTESVAPSPGELVAFEKRLKREMGSGLVVALLGFASAFAPLLVASLLAKDWSMGVIAWSVGGAFAVAAFLGGMVVGRRAARQGTRRGAVRFLGAVLGLSSVAAGVMLIL